MESKQNKMKQYQKKPQNIKFIHTEKRRQLPETGGWGEAGIMSKGSPQY